MFTRWADGVSSPGCSLGLRVDNLHGRSRDTLSWLRSLTPLSVLVRDASALPTVSKPWTGADPCRKVISV